ncbi:MAG: HEAT repeat domain-containing protein [Promethearchaeota archaeon]
MGKNNDFYPDPKKNPYRVQPGYSPSKPFPPQTPPIPSTSSQQGINFDILRLCPKCGKIIKISYKFCKFCGLNLSEIPSLKDSDDISKQLALTAITDPESSVRKEAVDTLGNFKEFSVLGVLTHVLLNDPDENVRKVAAHELGELAHLISLDPLTAALKDQSPKVRKEAIEGLKKIREKIKPKEKEKEEIKEKIKENSSPTISEQNFNSIPKIMDEPKEIELEEVPLKDTDENKKSENNLDLEPIGGEKETKLKEKDVDELLDEI